MININLKSQNKRGRSSGGGGGTSKLRSFSFPKLKIGSQIKDPFKLGVLVLGLAWLGFVGLSYVTSLTQLASLEPRLEQSRAENARFREFFEEKKRLRLVQDSIQHQIATIRAVDGDRYVWPRMLDEIARALPQYTWLTSIEFVPAPKPVVDTTSDSTKAKKGPPPAPPVAVIIKGKTIEIQGYTRFLRQLEDAPHLMNVTAVNTNTAIEANRAVKTFVLTLMYENPNPATPVQPQRESASLDSKTTVVAQREN